MEILSFDVVGKVAHFRRYNSNSTALSHYIPPRTTIMGMLAGMLGLSRDSYYNSLSSNNIRIGVFVASPLKLTIHRMNYLKIKNLGDFRGRNSHVQTPVEMITGNDIVSDFVRYTIYVSCFDCGVDMFNDVVYSLSNGIRIYNLTLGIASANACIENVMIHRDVKMYNSVDDEINIHSTVKSDNIIGWPSGCVSRITQDILPSDFVANNDRSVSKFNNVVFTVDNTPLKIKYSGEYYTLTDNSTNICFME